MSDAEHPSGIETQSVASGWVATRHHGDGTSTDYWGVTENDARRKAQEAEQ